MQKQDVDTAHATATVFKIYIYLWLYSYDTVATRSIMYTIHDLLTITGFFPDKSSKGISYKNGRLPLWCSSKPSSSEDHLVATSFLLSKW